MMKVRLTPKCSRDLKKLKKKHYNLKEFEEVVQLIVQRDTETLVRAFKDHPLKGNWQGFRECHIQADWLLIYRINNEEKICELVLTRTGSHDELF